MALIPPQLSAAVAECLRLHPQPWRGVCDYDADGLTSAALWSLQYPIDFQPVNSRQHWVPREGPVGVVALDLACPQKLAGAGPTLIIDHHALPEALPQGVLMVNPRDWETPGSSSPLPCTSLLVAELLPPPPERRWVAAVGALSDLGEGAPFELLQQQLQLHGRRSLRKISGLVNSPHRARGCPARALQALLEERTPKQFLRSNSEALKYLQDCQSRVESRLHQARRASPQKFGPVALLEIQSDCSVQSMLAQSWKIRYPELLVVVGNRGEDEVQVSARCQGNRDLLEPLRRLGLGVQGHPSSAGARVTAEAWEAFKESLRANYPH